MKYFTSIVMVCFLFIFSSVANAEEMKVDGKWSFAVGTKKYELKIKTHPYTEVAPISGTITTPEGDVVEILKCSDKQMGGPDQPPYIPYLDGNWPSTCSFINADPSSSIPVVVLRTKLKYVWIFGIKNNKIASGAIFDRTNLKKITDIKGIKH